MSSVTHENVMPEKREAVASGVVWVQGVWVQGVWVQGVLVEKAVWYNSVTGFCVIQR